MPPQNLRNLLVVTMPVPGKTNMMKDKILLREEMMPSGVRMVWCDQCLFNHPYWHPHLTSPHKKRKLKSQVYMAWNALHWNPKLQTQLLKRSSRMSKKPSPIERKVKKYLKELNFKFANQVVIGPFICDFVDETNKLVIECDGAQWHSSDRQKENDEKRDGYLARQGYRVLHLLGWQCWNKDVAVGLIQEFVQSSLVSIGNLG